MIIFPFIWGNNFDKSIFLTHNSGCCGVRMVSATFLSSHNSSTKTLPKTGSQVCLCHLIGESWQYVKKKSRLEHSFCFQHNALAFPLNLVFILNSSNKPSDKYTRSHMEIWMWSATQNNSKTLLFISCWRRWRSTNICDLIIFQSDKMQLWMLLNAKKQRVWKPSSTAF